MTYDGDGDDDSVYDDVYDDDVLSEKMDLLMNVLVMKDQPSWVIDPFHLILVV